MIIFLINLKNLKIVKLKLEDFINYVSEFHKIVLLVGKILKRFDSHGEFQESIKQFCNFPPIFFINYLY